jgi:hypothetical protein
MAYPPPAPSSAYSPSTTVDPWSATPGTGSQLPSDVRYELLRTQPDLTDLALAQRSLVWAIIINFVMYVIRAASSAMLGPAGLVYSPLGGLVTILGWVAFLVALAMTLWGEYQIAKSFGWSGATPIILYLISFIPFVSLAVLVVLNIMATLKLKAGGYKVGLLGAEAF